MQEPTRMASNIIVIQNNKILLLLRNAGWKTGFWGPPGGIADEEESPKDTAIRETFEETGLTINQEDLHFLMAKIKRDFGAVWFYITDKYSGDVELSWEHKDYKWFDIEELSEDITTLKSHEVEVIKNSFLMNP